MTAEIEILADVCHALSLTRHPVPLEEVGQHLVELSRHASLVDEIDLLEFGGERQMREEFQDILPLGGGEYFEVQSDQAGQLLQVLVRDRRE